MKGKTDWVYHKAEPARSIYQQAHRLYTNSLL